MASQAALIPLVALLPVWGDRVLECRPADQVDDRAAAAALQADLAGLEVEPQDWEEPEVEPQD